MLQGKLQDPMVQADWLYERLNDPSIVILDCRFILGQPDLGRADYDAGHIPGAVYISLESDLSGQKTEQGHGGRHPLPSTSAMEALFSRIGIDQHTTVVAYDGDDLAMAARLWWMLRYVGHERVYVLDGGYAAWNRANYPTSTEILNRKPRSFTANVQSDMLLTKNEVVQRESSTPLLDSRAPERYRGDMEPLDSKAGHIPGATCFFYKNTLQADGTLKTKEQLQNYFGELLQQEQIIVYCGSGVTACVNLLALMRAGRPDAKLYGGSWSDWSSYPDSPVATGDE
ncbi:sulfurtransferase [Brevibacillus laterosporus]|uniref:sulfurtransferase n=1 Tax=Brevibacillus laterosporus TaxID=1465 RepID=UPI00264C8462|nr:sulfurtransferase [Brevibacillus laterosporus]MDN9009842.1 sulfurtransferase [Brevibacillus laterosporus]MDO0940776.1 sulfurtransferase [Brevibacillus laterosporus]